MRSWKNLLPVSVVLAGLTLAFIEIPNAGGQERAPAETTPADTAVLLMEQDGKPAPKPAPASAPTPPRPQPTPAPDEDIAPEPETLATFDSSVGYIDNAVPTDLIRFRFDTAYKNNRPNRAEYFYAKGAPGGPGLPLPETSVDYQELTTYVEHAFRPRFSGFIETPARFLDPQVNDPEDGFGDMTTGFKYAFQYREAAVSSFQLRTFIPTGNPNRGLGTNHVSLEPALLFYRQPAERLRVEGEFRYWIPVGGTDFAGDLFRYGIGASYGERPRDRCWLSPVTELVGWTVLSGKETVVQVPGATPVIQSAAGDTIVNAKAGFRFGFGDRADVYFGYGRALTGDVWYKNLWRLEFRLFY